MPGRNREDVARYEALHKSLYQAQLTLDAQTSCPQSHPFSDGFDSEDGQVVKVKVNVHIDPDGRVVCRLCNNARGLHYRQQIAEGAGVS